MQHPYPRYLTARRTGGHSKPLVVVGQLDGTFEIEFGGIAQTREAIRIAVGNGDQEFPGIKAVGFPTGAVHDAHAVFRGRIVEYREHKRGPRLTPRR